MLKVAQSQKGFQFGSNLQRKVPNHAPELRIDSSQGRDLAPLFDDFNQNEKKNLEEIQNQTAIGKIEKRLKKDRNISKCLEMS